MKKIWLSNKKSVPDIKNFLTRIPGFYINKVSSDESKLTNR